VPAVIESQPYQEFGLLACMTFGAMPHERIRYCAACPCSPEDQAVWPPANRRGDQVHLTLRGRCRVRIRVRLRLRVHVRLRVRVRPSR
jgi:hypothetical protein